MPRPSRSTPGHRPRSETTLLRRLINNLKERGSEVAEELERKAHNFLTDVKSKKKPQLQVPPPPTGLADICPLPSSSQITPQIPEPFHGLPSTR